MVDGTSRLISVVGLKDVMDSGNSGMPFMRGAAVVDATQDVCVGCSNGDIAVFQMAANSNARLQRTVKCHEAPISTMTGGGDLVASGDDEGQVCLWNAQFDQQAIFPGEGLPCTCLGMHNDADALVAGFAHGVLRIVQLSTREVTVEVAAHSRCIMALDVHPTQPIFTTVSEDTYMKVWALPDSEDKSASEVALIYEERVEDRFLTGVQFTRDGSERILAAAYDSKELLVWDRA
uniref:WD repeat-containing protein 54 beta-propeller domain-containing protein n=1 Tax=Florenciella parvula TaxID=236787 RepID=A0A7S2FDR9_9STRA